MPNSSDSLARKALWFRSSKPAWNPLASSSETPKVRSRGDFLQLHLVRFGFEFELANQVGREQPAPRFLVQDDFGSSSNPVVLNVNSPYRARPRASAVGSSNFSFHSLEKPFSTRKP